MTPTRELTTCQLSKMPSKRTKKKEMKVIRVHKAKIRIKGEKEKHKTKEGDLEKSIDKIEKNQFSEFISSGKAIVPILKATQTQTQEPVPVQPATQARRAAQQPREIYGAAVQTQDKERNYQSVVLQQETAPTAIPMVRRRQLVRDQTPIAERRLLAEEDSRKKYELEEKKSTRRRYPWEV